MPGTLQDPRSYQIAVLASLLLWGLLGLGLDQRPAAVAVLLGVALGTQVLCCRIRGLAVDLQSPLISGLSLCLLARSNSLALLAVTAALSIGSKFLLRVHGKHVFNPTNFGLVAMLLLSERVWVSPGQWGSATFFAFLLVGAGGLVVYRARRSDVTWAFLLAHAGVLCGRALWLGDPWSIPLHQLESGALLIFAFFMISDPKTTPDSRAGRIVFAVLVAVSGGAIRVYLHNSLGLLWALAACAPLVPLLDWLLPAERYRWPQDAAPSGRLHLTRNRDKTPGGSSERSLHHVPLLDRPRSSHRAPSGGAAAFS